MARLKQNFKQGTLGASLTNSGTTITFATAPGFGAISAPNFLPLILDPDGTPEVVWVTAYTSGTSATISRGKEGTTGASHSNGVTWVHGPTILDFASVARNFNVVTATDPISGDSYNYLTFDVEGTVMAWGLVGDAFPRTIIAADPDDGIMMADGTVDPYNDDGASIRLNVSGQLIISAPSTAYSIDSQITLSAPGVQVFGGDVYVWNVGKGFIIRSPDGNPHRIKIANDGTLSTEAVPSWP